VRGYLVDVPKALREVFFFLERLFNKSFTVHTATQSRYKREKRQEASDEVIVAKKFL
jgi:hypothetical protein